MARGRMWLLVGCVLVVIGCLAVVWLVDVENARVQKQIDLTIQVIGLLAAVGGVVIAVLGLRKPGDVRIPHGGEWPGSRQSTAAALGEPTSLALLYRQTSTQLAELDADVPGFVGMTVSADANRARPGAMTVRPQLEWLQRRSVQYSEAKPEEIDLSEVQRRFPRAVLLGEPGSGKSTCLRQIVRDCLGALRSDAQQAGKRESEQEAENAGDQPGPLIPLYVSLSEWYEPRMPALDFLQGRLEALVGSGNYYVRNFERLLVEGRLLIVCDGLNELPGRRASSHEGRHEQAADDSGRFGKLKAAAGSDPRERSLRDLAAQLGAHSQFILSCRSHEYFDSLQWQVVRVLPMTSTQVGTFIATYAPDSFAPALRTAMAGNPALAEMAANPFFLRVIVDGYTPSFDTLGTRGELMGVLYDRLLQREVEQRDDIDEKSLTEVAGRIAFRMLKRGNIGNQVALPSVRADLQPSIDVLSATGLLVRREGKYYFYHQIVQEYFAAEALARGTVRRSPATLLADKRWTEVVALWLDLSPDRMYRRLLRGLSARNLPWRRPRSYPSPSLSSFQGLSSCAIFVLAVSIALDWLLWPVETLRSPVDLIPLTAFQWIVLLLAIRLVWKPLVPHGRVVVNAVRVLSLRDRVDALPQMIRAFGRVVPLERAELAADLGRLGSQAVPYCLDGLADRRSRVRAGCVVTLGELARQGADDHSDIVSALLAVSESADPDLNIPVIQALHHCRDERVPEGIASIITGAQSWGVMTMARSGALATMSESVRDPAYGKHAADRLVSLTHDDQPPQVRTLAIRLVGVFNIPGSAERLADLANDQAENPTFRAVAIAGLGVLSTPEAAESLVDIAESDFRTADAVAAALRTLRDPDTIPALTAAAEVGLVRIREASAVAFGHIGGSQALAVLDRLAQDPSDEVRSASAHALGTVGSLDSLPLLAALAGDDSEAVRAAAFDALEGSFPDRNLPILLELASDPDYPDQERVIRLVSGHQGAAVETALRQLAVRGDSEVRQLAQKALTEVRANRTASRRPRFASWRHPLRAVGQAVSRMLQLELIETMRREERLNGTPPREMLAVLQKRINADAELTRKFRILLRAVIVSVIVGFAIVLLLLLALMRVVLTVAGWEADHWKLCLVVIGVGAASYAPGLRELRGVRIAGVVVAILRGVATTLVVIVVAAALFYVWWTWLALAGLGLGFVLVRRRVRSRRGGIDVRASPFFDRSAASPAQPSPSV